MAILEILTLGDPVLRSKAAPVTSFDASLRSLASEMRETMIAAPGVGLAAPQVGKPIRLFVFDSGEESGSYANPEIVWSSAEREEGEEGCLSLPGVYFPVARATAVRVRAQELDGTPVECEAEGFLARIFQHEIDHLDGVLFIERLAPDLRREAMRRIRDRDFAPPLRGARAKAL